MLWNVFDLESDHCGDLPDANLLAVSELPGCMLGGLSFWLVTSVNSPQTVQHPPHDSNQYLHINARWHSLTTATNLRVHKCVACTTSNYIMMGVDADWRKGEGGESLLASRLGSEPFAVATP